MELFYRSLWTHTTLQDCVIENETDNYVAESKAGVVF